MAYGVSWLGLMSGSSAQLSLQVGTIRIKSQFSPALHFLIALACFLSFVFFSSVVFAGVPRTIHYQGKLTGSDGSPIVGEHTVTLRLYDAASGGTLLWQEQHDLSLVRADSGIFSVVL